MTVDEMMGAVKRHRRAALVGGIGGLALLTAYLAYEFAMTPARPDPRTAQAAEVVTYIADARGLPRLSQIEEQRFLQQWRDVLLQEPRNKEELKLCLADLGDQQRKSFSEAIFKHFKRAFLDDAGRYGQTPKDLKYEYLETKVAQYRQQAVFLKDVAMGFSKQFSGRQDDLQKWIMEHTSAEERAVGEPYLEALKRVREQIRKQQPAAASSPAETPG
jgi:hypothetical protein